MEALRAGCAGYALSRPEISSKYSSRSSAHFKWKVLSSECLSMTEVSKMRSPVVTAAKVKETEGSILSTEGLRFAVVAARFNDIITKPLVKGALETFKRYSVKEEHIEVIWVPGSFEIPIVAQTLGKSGKYDAVLCIGAVIRGATSHYDAVANSATSGIMSASLNSGVPCIFGVLTCDTMEQAFDRAGGKVGNKGGEAALTAIEMASLLKHQVHPSSKMFA